MVSRACLRSSLTDSRASVTNSLVSLACWRARRTRSRISSTDPEEYSLPAPKDEDDSGAATESEVDDSAVDDQESLNEEGIVSSRCWSTMVRVEGQSLQRVIAKNCDKGIFFLACLLR